MGDSTVETEVLMAAHEGSEHAEQAERRDIGEATLEQLHADVARLSVESMTGEPFPLFREMRRVRARIYRLLDGNLRPADQANLYFLLGCLNDLMAVAASGLGYPQAAEELIRSGWAYATAIDHRPLMAHLRLQLASILFWENRPRQARDLAEDVLRYLQDGPNAAHLHVKYARAAARLGDAESARRAIADAEDAREREHSDEVLALGGEFGLSVATQSYFAGSALAELEGSESEAAEHLERAVASYDSGPGPGEQYWFGGGALAGVDLAAVRLRAGALDSAAGALELPLSLPSAQRINAVTTRLNLVRAELAAPIFQHSPQARELDERIEEFGSESITAELRGLSGSPG
jgi:tetratricopeptide (TPR) repeat protein